MWEVSPGPGSASRRAIASASCWSSVASGSGGSGEALVEEGAEFGEEGFVEVEPRVLVVAEMLQDPEERGVTGAGVGRAAEVEQFVVTAYQHVVRSAGGTELFHHLVEYGASGRGGGVGRR